MTNQKAIIIIQTEKECVCRNWKENCDRNCGDCDLVMDAEETLAAYDMAIAALEQQEREKWHPLTDGNYPDDDRLALVSFDNVDGIDIARFRTDEAGGMFCPGDMDRSYTSYGVFVNAWKERPERYDGGET